MVLGLRRPSDIHGNRYVSLLVHPCATIYFSSAQTGSYGLKQRAPKENPLHNTRFPMKLRPGTALGPINYIGKFDATPF